VTKRSSCEQLRILPLMLGADQRSLVRTALSPIVLLIHKLWVRVPRGPTTRGNFPSECGTARTALQQRLIGAEPAQAFPPTLGTLDAKRMCGQQKALSYCPRSRVLCANERAT
jgi:hypothetical protein